MDAKTERPPDADRQQGVRVSFDGGRCDVGSTAASMSIPALGVRRPPSKAVSTLLSAIDDEPNRIKAPSTTATASPSEVSVRSGLE